jgi:hypothetical protein
MVGNNNTLSERRDVQYLSVVCLIGDVKVFQNTVDKSQPLLRMISQKVVDLLFMEKQL